MTTPVADPDSTIKATSPGARADREAALDAELRWTGGRIALIVAVIGLLGAALGAAWFGLAERAGVAPGGPAGTVLLVVAVALLVIGLLLVVGGLGYYVLAPAFLGPRMARYGVGSHRLVIATTILIVLLANAGPVVYMALVGVQDLRSLPGLVTAALSVDVALLGITYLRFIRPGVLTVADLGLDPRRLVQQVGIGLLVGVGVLTLSALIQAAMQFIGVQQTQLAGMAFIREFSLPGFLALVLAGGVLAPIAEELYFRGVVFRTYYQSRGPLVAYGATSLLFAVLHLNLPALLPILVLSLVFCYAYRQTGSIVPSIVGHALNNSAAFCILYFTNAPLGAG